MVFSSLTVHLLRRLCWSATWIFVLLVVLGGAGMLLSELERSAFSVTPKAFLWVFLGGLPGLVHYLLPISALVALLMWGSSFRESRGWLALRISGRGGRYLLRGVGVFAMLFALMTLVVGLCFRDAGTTLRANALWEGATPVAGKTVALEEIRFLPLGTGSSMQGEGVAFELHSPPSIGYAKKAVLHKKTRQLILENGRLQHTGADESRLSFSKMAIALPQVSTHSVDVLQQRAEHLKELSWPLMSFFLLLISLPLVLRSQTSTACFIWLGMWAIIRLCDHQVGMAGPVVTAWLPCGFAGLLCVWVWVQWEDA